jgi:hypothetical protein
MRRYLVLVVTALTLGVTSTVAVASVAKAPSPGGVARVTVSGVEHTVSSTLTSVGAALHQQAAHNVRSVNTSRRANDACPPTSKNPGGSPACGKDHHGSTPPPACGPADMGGSPATGPVSGVLYGAGKSVGGPVGDAVQQIACALFTNLHL